MDNIKCGKLVSGEFFIGKVVSEKVIDNETILCIENLSSILLQPTEEEGKIQIGIVPMNPFCKKDQIIEINKNKILFNIIDIPDV
ncbi:MAG: hypothetical protein NT094_03930, partial [Candidatus Staskawiczbacteria bacterium]|nr:hypothetical protein [Candidatus Staskawiczbacteria bacterium]